MDKYTITEILKAWKTCYNEDMELEYSGFVDKLKEKTKKEKMTKKEYIVKQVDNTDNDFVNELLYEHYNNEVKDMTEEEFQQHIKNIYE